MIESARYADYLVAMNICPLQESKELRILSRRIVYLSYKNDPEGTINSICGNLGDVDGYDKVIASIEKIYQENE